MAHDQLIKNGDIIDSSGISVLTFESRADLLQNPTLGTITCDATILVYGVTGTLCSTP